MLIRALIAAVLFASATGCATESALRLSEEPGFQAGYGDGCATATEEDKSFSTKRMRNDYQFENDRAYRGGWRQGYLSCGGRAGQQSDGGLVLGQENEY